MKRVLLWGGRSKARIITDMITALGGHEVAIIYDSTLDRLPFDSTARFLNDVAALREALASCSHFAVCVGGESGFARHTIAKRLEERGLAPLTIVHDQAFIEPSASYGSGCQFMARAVLGKFSRLGEQVILNTSCTVDHECALGHGCHVMGGATIAGRVTIADYATIGTNATILPDISIGRGAVVGAGAVVTRDVPDLAVCVGVPARVTRQHTLRADLDALDRL